MAGMGMPGIALDVSCAAGCVGSDGVVLGLGAGRAAGVVLFVAAGLDFRLVPADFELRFGFAPGFAVGLAAGRSGGGGIFMPGIAGITCRLVSCCAAKQPGRRTVAARRAIDIGPTHLLTGECPGDFIVITSIHKGELPRRARTRARVDRRRADARADHEHRIVRVRSYAFGGGGSGAVATDASIESESAGSLLAGHRAEERATTLAIVVTPQLDIDSQHRS